MKLALPTMTQQLTNIFSRALTVTAAFGMSLLLLGAMPAVTHAKGFPERQIGGHSLPSLAPIIDQAGPAVVNIATYTIQRRYNPLMQSPFFRRFFDLPDQIEETRRANSAGSGVVFDAEQGYIVTNHHVIAGSNDIEVTIKDGRTLKATLIGSDEKVDIALLKVEASGLTAIPLGDARSLMVGDFVIAIGNPFGLSQTVTSGIVSALGRNGLGIQGYEDFIQTDASINPGNSGGALIDLNGRLVGINSAIIAPAGGNVGIGFAIPTDITQAIVNQLVQYGEVRRGGIGARFQDLTPELAEAFSLNTFQGAVVSKVAQGSSAAKAGLMLGDIVIEADGRAVRNATDIHNRIGLSALGDRLQLSVLRNGKTRSLSVDIAAIPIPEAEGENVSPRLTGSRLKDYIPSGEEEAAGVSVLTLSKNSNAARLGLEKGDIIYGVDRQRVRNLEELKHSMRQRRISALHIQRGYQDLILYLQ